MCCVGSQVDSGKGKSILGQLEEVQLERCLNGLEEVQSTEKREGPAEEMSLSTVC